MERENMKLELKYLNFSESIMPNFNQIFFYGIILDNFKLLSLNEEPHTSEIRFSILSYNNIDTDDDPVLAESMVECTYVRDDMIFVDPKVFIMLFISSNTFNKLIRKLQQFEKSYLKNKFYFNIGKILNEKKYEIADDYRYIIKKKFKILDTKILFENNDDFYIKHLE